MTENNTEKPRGTRREGVKESLHRLYNVLISQVENHVFVARQN